MSFSIFTDTAGNVETALAKELGITVIPMYYYIDEKEYNCADTAQFNEKEFYDMIRSGVKVNTSQINPSIFEEYFEMALKEGKDVVYAGLSSGISGTFTSANIAKEQLEGKYPDRKIYLIDSLGASLGEGLLAIYGAEFKNQGISVEETVKRLEHIRDCMYQVFMVDDLMHLKRTGRLSNMGAVVGSVLGVKPILKGNEHGKIVVTEKVRGRRQVIKKIIEKCEKLGVAIEDQIIGISHCDCKEDAKNLADILKEKLNPKKILVVAHEPVTGAHIGPGSLALYFRGNEKVRYE